MPAMSDLVMQPLAWATGMLVLHALATGALWAALRADVRRLPLQHTLQAALRQPHARWSVPLVRGLYLAGIPALALALRVFPTPSHMGFRLPEQPVWAVCLSLLIGLAAAAVPAVMWPKKPRFKLAGLRGAAPTRQTASDLGSDRDEGSGAAAAVGLLAADVVLREVHWLFVRAVAFSVWPSTSSAWLPGTPVGAALWLSLVLLALEAWSSPFVRASSSDPVGRSIAARSAIAAISSTAAYGLFGSALASAAAHAATRLALRRVAGPDSHAAGLGAPHTNATGPARAAESAQQFVTDSGSAARKSG